MTEGSITGCVNEAIFGFQDINCCHLQECVKVEVQRLPWEGIGDLSALKVERSLGDGFFHEIK